MCAVQVTDNLVLSSVATMLLCSATALKLDIAAFPFIKILAFNIYLFFHWQTVNCGSAAWPFIFSRSFIFDALSWGLLGFWSYLYCMYNVPAVQGTVVYASVFGVWIALKYTNIYSSGTPKTDEVWMCRQEKHELALGPNMKQETIPLPTLCFSETRCPLLQVVDNYNCWTFCKSVRFN